MVYDLKLSEGCPTEAAKEFEGEAYRVVKTDPPTHSDLLTYLEMNLYPTADPCKRGAISDGFFDFPLPIERILYEAEQPIVYVTKTKQGQEMLAYLAEETDNHQFIIVAPSTLSSLSRLESGSIGIREALTDTWMWMVRADLAQKSTEVWRVTEATIPSQHLPRPGIPL